MATIRKRGTKWHVQVRRQGSPPLTKSFTLKADAELWARQMEAEADRAGLPVDRQKALKVTLRELIVRYRDTVVARKRSVVQQTRHLNRALQEPFVDRFISDITPGIISSYRDLRLETVKPSTVVKELGILPRMFEVAIKEWDIPLQSNPVKAISKPKAGPGRDRRVDGMAEKVALKRAAEKCRNPLIEPAYSFAIETGMRRGELLALTWDDIDTRKRTLHIPKTKNGHPRTIPLSTAALKILEGLKKPDGDKDEPRVFPMTANALRLAWRRLRERAGAKGLRFHDLRHEAVSSFFEKGLSVPEVALISGHKDARMLFRYTHLKPEDVAKKLG